MGWELRGSVFEFWHGKPCAFMVGDEKLAATRAGEIQSVLRACTKRCSSGFTSELIKHPWGSDHLFLHSSRTQDKVKTLSWACSSRRAVRVGLDPKWTLLFGVQ